MSEISLSVGYYNCVAAERSLQAERLESFVVLIKFGRGQKREDIRFSEMSDFSHLTSYKVNAGLLQELACNELIEILSKCEGTKVRN